MSDQFLGEIRPCGFNFAPTGWAQCNGQLLPVSQNTALFSLLGTDYGGDGVTTFALPNLQGTFPLQFGQGAGLSYREIGEAGGSATVTLINEELPSHSHQVLGAPIAGDSTSPGNNTFANPSEGGSPGYAYALPTGTKVNMDGAGLSGTGGGQPHDNMPPYLVVNFCIALTGIFPARS